MEIEALNNSDERVTIIAKKILNKKKRKVKKETLAFIGNLGNKMFRERVNFTDKNFYADENCDSCGICKKVCPVNNIKIVAGKPRWHNQCQQCLACLHFCPQEAIQYGKNTLGRRRYHHPEISFFDMIYQKENPC
ncbi:MAG: hypothetical protein EU539_14035 [Promethearchaeota archaeon]|nr:MAG: hypothetical protein EU539_14035 [Candidatus Lokiarchaeota archaeon]